MADSVPDREALVPMDALPGTAALVDSDGVIVAVNDRWMSFALDQGAAREAVGVGSNYFAACVPAGSDLDAEAAQRGLQAVLDREQPEFELTYPCHGPDVQRWFRLTATPVDRDGRRLALVLHVNVTENELRTRLLTELTGAALLELDASGNLMYATSAWEKLAPHEGGGVAPGHAASERSRDWLDAFDPADAENLATALDVALVRQHSMDVYARLRTTVLPGEAGRLGPNVRRVRIEGHPQVANGMLARYAVTVVEVQADPEERARLRNEATRDPLTRLSNRAGLKASADFEPLTPNDSLLCLDLDGFKAINDVGGHATGDAVLNAVASRIRGSLRPNDIAARVGGDEFVVVLRDLTAAQTHAAAQRLLASIVRPIHAGGSDWTVGSSIGIARPQRGQALELVLEHADAALLEAKAAGKNRTVWFTDTGAHKAETTFAPPADLFGHYQWHAGGHLMTFPGTEDELVDEVSRYLLTGFDDGEAGLLIATKAHTQRILGALAYTGLDPDQLQRSGQLVVLDAEAIVAGFLRDGRPDAALYRSTVGDCVQAITEHWPRARAYSEMVAVLWAAGNLPAAFMVEDLWNELADELPFLLVCAYQAPQPDTA